ncbi:unnamed protein product [Camellia sinensis]
MKMSDGFSRDDVSDSLRSNVVSGVWICIEIWKGKGKEKLEALRPSWNSMLKKSREMGSESAPQGNTARLKLNN